MSIKPKTNPFIMYKLLKYISISVVVLLLQSNPLFSQDKVTLQVSGACGMCKDRIETTSKKVAGVQSAEYDIEAQQLTVTVNDKKFDKNKLIAAILAVGHDAEGQKASDEAYESLHECCHYREGHENESDDHHHDSMAEPTTETQEEHHEAASTSSPSNKLTGTVFEKNDSGELLPVIGAVVRWMNDKNGVLTDIQGQFETKIKKKSDYLVVDYIGYSPDTILIEKTGNINITISTLNVLNEVQIVHKKRSTEVSYLQPVKVQQISSKELLKAACCNLAESFDTTPAIDAATTDAVTGTRKIEMLGLAGPYVQITRENVPAIRGLAALQGLTYIPGPWIESMQLNMGAGSVVNGYESITGQINVELRKPAHEDELYLNAYGNQSGRLEFNLFNRNIVNDRWSTANLIHASTRNVKSDGNNDGFLDMPLGRQFEILNRWKWSNNEGQEGQFGVNLIYSDNESGQKGFDPGRSDRSKIWGADMRTNRVEFWAKRGFVNIDAPYKSLGLQVSGSYHDQKSQFGLRRYDAIEKSLYFNMIYQSIINNTDHQVRMGASFQMDDITENVAQNEYLRSEYVPGVFGEYTYMGSEKFTVLLGARADYHNNYGLFFTPRVNLRYAPDQRTVFRIAAGRGQRTASIFAENIGLFASSRDFIIEGGDKSKTPYGLNPEVAWNLGLSVTKEIPIGKRTLALSGEYNRIQFTNQVVVDLDRTARQVVFYNLNGTSYSNSFQAQADLDVADWMDLRLAYRYNDVQTTYGEELLRKPLTSPHRAFANTALKFGKGWVMDYTVNWLSAARIPSTLANDEAHKLPDTSPSYFLSNTQITKSWKNGFDVYVGGENIFNYKMDNPILSADNPFGTYFDSSLIWGPIFGANFYVGVRYALK